MKREDFEGPTWQTSVMEIGAEKVKIDEFTFDKMRVSNNPFMLLMLLMIIDPTEKQKEILEKFEVVFDDDNKRRVFPRVDAEKELVKDSGAAEVEKRDEKFIKDILKMREEAIENIEEGKKELEKIKQEMEEKYNPQFLENTNEDK